MKHTSTPWYVECFNDDDVINIRAKTGRGMTRHIVYMQHNDEEIRANAEFIVKAVNNHYQLLEACKLAISGSDIDWGILEEAIKQADSQEAT